LVALLARVDAVSKAAATLAVPLTTMMAAEGLQRRRDAAADAAADAGDRVSAALSMLSRNNTVATLLVRVAAIYFVTFCVLSACMLWCLLCSLRVCCGVCCVLCMYVVVFVVFSACMLWCLLCSLRVCCGVRCVLCVYVEVRLAAK
jgi:hypothetical protein